MNTEMKAIETMKVNEKEGILTQIVKRLDLAVTEYEETLFRTEEDMERISSYDKLSEKKEAIKRTNNLLEIINRHIDKLEKLNNRFTGLHWHINKLI